jgi:hypothetical protein
MLAMAVNRLAKDLVQRLPSTRFLGGPAAEIGTSRYQVVMITWTLALAERDGTPSPYRQSDRLAMASADTLVRNGAVLYDCRYLGIEVGAMGYLHNCPFTGAHLVAVGFGRAPVVVYGDRAATWRARYQKGGKKARPDRLDLRMATDADNRAFAGEANALVQHWSRREGRLGRPPGNDPWWIWSELVGTYVGERLEKRYGYRAV